MPRLPEILERDAVPEGKRENYDYLVKTRGAVRAPFSILLHSPEIAGRVAHVGTYVRFENSLPQAVVEIAALAAVREFDCAPEWGAHSRLALEAGVAQSTLDAIGAKGKIDGLQPDESLTVRYARELLTTHKVSDAMFSEARTRFGDQGVIDLTATVGYYAMIGCLLNAVEAPTSPGAAPLPPL